MEYNETIQGYTNAMQGGWENRLVQCLLLKMKGLLPVVVFGGVVVGAAENGSHKILAYVYNA